jgi:hypothetical protein
MIEFSYASAATVCVDLGTDYYTARVSQRLSLSHEVRATALCFTFFILAFVIEQDKLLVCPPPFALNH